jgi:hypothetical protein
MPIRGKSLGEVSRLFVDHLYTVLHTTITQTPLSLEVLPDRGVANIRFRSGVQSTTAALKTRYGPMGLYIGQLCDSVVGGDRLHTLRTTRYRYALVPAGHGQPFLRWEHVRFPGTTALYCRHHVHARSDSTLPIPTACPPCSVIGTSQRAG